MALTDYFADDIVCKNAMRLNDIVARLCYSNVYR